MFFWFFKKEKKAYYASTAAILHISVRTRPQKVHAPEWKWLWVCVIALNVRKWETNWPWMSDLLSPVKRPIHAHSQPPKVMNKRPFENKLQTLLLLLLPLRTYNYIVIYICMCMCMFLGERRTLCRRTVQRSFMGVHDVNGCSRRLLRCLVVSRSQVQECGDLWSPQFSPHDKKTVGMLLLVPPSIYTYTRLWFPKNLPLFSLIPEISFMLRII